uniref:ISXO2-like transposase domain-containing protein n=1 Tax=Magallana gigas TaxID=29159 RepID=A0A8W8NU68_MAGGI
MVERETNTLLIYPVPDMSEDTVVPIIERHVEAWSTIYNGGWSAYCGLNELGYNHSTVLHKHSFKKVYIYQETKEEVEIHTNRIEGAWKHAKDNFRRMSGTKISRFEGHLCEITWRAETKIKYLPELLLDSAVQLGEWEIKPGNTDAETDSGAEGERSSSLFSAIEADSISITSNRQLSSSELAVRKGQVRSSVERAIDMMEMFVSSEDEVDADKTICAMETGDDQDLGETGPSELQLHPSVRQMNHPAPKQNQQQNALKVIGLKEHQLKWLCNHLRHTGKVHETHYRATSGLIERVEIAKLLLIQENNMAGQFAGQDLSEIQFEDILVKDDGKATDDGKLIQMLV